MYMHMYIEAVGDLGGAPLLPSPPPRNTIFFVFFLKHKKKT